MKKYKFLTIKPDWDQKNDWATPSWEYHEKFVNSHISEGWKFESISPISGAKHGEMLLILSIEEISEIQMIND